VLREVFDLDYDEIAAAVDKTPAAVRQIAHRARNHVAARRPRGTPSAAQTRGALAAFQRAIETGDLQGLLDMLAPDVVMLGDGGGVRQAFPEPVVGTAAVAEILSVGLGRLRGLASFELAQINGSPALLVHADGEVSVVAMQVSEGRIAGLYIVRNPEKLSRVDCETPMSR